VLGAVIQLGNCFDLLDIEFTQMLANDARDLENGLAAQGISLPTNQSVSNRDFDWLRRERDCYVLNYVIPQIEESKGIIYHSVRSVFQEGDAAFSGAGMKLKSHIQIAVRDPRAILGYFNPEPT
jgi:hypothetical protein